MSKPISIRIPEDLKQQLRDLAALESKPVSEIIIDLLRMNITLKSSTYDTLSKLYAERGNVETQIEFIQKFLRPDGEVKVEVKKVEPVEDQITLESLFLRDFK